MGHPGTGRLRRIRRSRALTRTSTTSRWLAPPSESMSISSSPARFRTANMDFFTSGRARRQPSSAVQAPQDNRLRHSRGSGSTDRTRSCRGKSRGIRSGTLRQPKVAIPVGFGQARRRDLRALSGRRPTATRRSFWWSTRTPEAARPLHTCADTDLRVGPSPSCRTGLHEAPSMSSHRCRCRCDRLTYRVAARSLGRRSSHAC